MAATISNITFAGSNVSRTDLQNRAAALKGQVLPYNSAMQAQNDSFIASLNNYQGNTLGEIKANAEKQVADHQKAATATAHLNWMGAGLGVLGLAGLISHAVPGFVAAPLIVAGIAAEIVGGVASTNHQNQAAQARYFSNQVSEWGAALAAEQKAAPAAVAVA
jgi:hypothetical protein